VKTWLCQGREFIDWWNRFWFESLPSYPLSLFRVLFVLTLLGMHIVRFVDIDLFFYEGGMVPSTLAPEMMFVNREPLFFWHPTSDAQALTYNLLYISSLLALLLGLGGRFTAVVATFFHLSLLQRNPSIVYGADLVSSFWLFFLCIGKSTNHLNLWHWLQKRYFNRSVTVSEGTGPLSTMAIRFFQIQLGVIYAITGWEKLRGGQWWEGNALWHVIGNPQLATIDMGFLKHFPWLIALTTLTVLVFEIYFPAMVWTNSRLKKTWLWMGVGMHVGIALLMGLYFFASVMLVSYIFFVEANTLKNFVDRWVLRKC
jgi:hypothetical protein